MNLTKRKERKRQRENWILSLRERTHRVGRESVSESRELNLGIGVDAELCRRLIYEAVKGFGAYLAKKN